MRPNDGNTSDRPPRATGRLAGRRRGRGVAFAAAVAVACASPRGAHEDRPAPPAPVHVQLTGWGPGSRVTGAGIDCTFAGGACATEVEARGRLVLTAEPGVGVAVKQWTGCAPASPDAATCTVTAGAGTRGGRAVGVTFGFPAPAPPPRRSGVALDVVGSGWGTVTGASLACHLGTQGTCNADLPEGVTVVLTATPGPNSWLASWRGCAAAPDAATCTLAVSGVVRVQATFDNGSGGGPFSPTQRLSVKAFGSRSGNRIAGAGIDCTSGAVEGSCSVDVDTGRSVTVRATPGPGSRFVRWNGCAKVEGDACSVTLAKPTWIAAVFEP